MSSSFGFLLAIAAGGLNGAFVLPMKRTTKWAWENTWLVYSFVGMVLVNGIIAFGNTPHLITVFKAAGLAACGMAFSFGCVWGIANLLFGLGIDLIGMSLSFPICIGLSTALGSLIPMAASPAVFGTPRGMATTLGVFVILLSVAICAVAGIRRDVQIAGYGSLTGLRGQLIRGLIVVALAGLFDPMLNFAFVFSEPIKRQAIALKAAAGSEADAVWALALLGSFCVNAVYCGQLLVRRGTWARYARKGVVDHWFLAALMGVIWMLSITIYGRGAVLIGDLGSSIGWAVFYSCIILSSNVWGIVTGEWSGGEGRPLRTLFVGLAVLLIAVCILGYGNSLPMQ